MGQSRTRRATLGLDGMTYDVVFDVSQRLPLFAIGIAAGVALAIVIGAGLWDSDAVLGWWAPVLLVGATCVGLQFLIAGEWPYLLVGAVMVGVGIALERAGPGLMSRGGRLPVGSALFVIGFFLLIFAAFQGLPMVGAIGLNQRLLDGQAMVVEGAVTVESLGKGECLVVDGQRFCYSEAVVSPGYNRERYLIGGLETGQHVRMSVIDGLIVRLEVGSAS
jgi:hypothetical protein